MSAIIKLKPGRDRSASGRHPWIFSGAIASTRGNPAPGDIVTVTAADGQFLARGYWNGASQIQVRALKFVDEDIDDAFWRRTLERAIRARNVVAESTNGYRLVYGENDYLPGLIVDRYGDYLVLQALTFGMDTHKWMIARLLEGQKRVLALGGGGFVDARTRALVKARAISVWLTADLDVLAHRTSRRSDRPLLRGVDPRARLAALLEARAPVYAEADLVVDSSRGSIRNVVGEILGRLADRPVGGGA